MRALGYLSILCLSLLLAAACTEAPPPATPRPTAAPVATTPQPTTSPTPLPTSTPAPTPTATALPISMAPNAVQQIVIPSEPSTFASLDGSVTVSLQPGTVADPTVLVYAPLAPADLPSLPDGFVAGEVRFDLTPFDPDGTRLPRLSLPGTIEMLVSLTSDDLEVAEGDPARITLQHNSDGRWTKLPTTVDLDSMTLVATVESLSVFAILIESEPEKRVALLRATPTAEPAPTPSPTPTPAAAPTPIPSDCHTNANRHSDAHYDPDT